MQNFVSAATGMAVLVALIRGFARRQAKTIGNFWVDLTRTTLYILLPLSLVLALVLVSQGVVQNFAPTRRAAGRADHVRQPVKDAAGKPVIDAAGKPITKASRSRADHCRSGPAASQIAIKQLGTNGGGFFNVELRASVREPDAALELPRDARDPADPGGALLHVRPHGEGHAAGLGACSPRCS